MFQNFLTLNRPISPHLTIYTSNQSSLFSIWHRISGVLLLLFIAIKLIYINNLGLCGIQSWFFTIDLKTIRIVFLFLTLIILYHLLNGIRHIFWDLGFLLNKIYFIYFTYLVLFLFFLLIKNF
uniref:Sdh3 n=1 Tax=Pterocladia lucida TaxID=31408 RepID=A0A6M3WWI4_PTELU|nr:Sdh3 [Pterocladia lucida]